MIKRIAPSAPKLTGLALAAGCVLAGLFWYATRPGGAKPAAEPAPAAAPAKDDASGLTLGQDQREFLWQVEHHGLLLGRHGFQPLAGALRRADAPALAALLAPGFQGKELARPREVAVKTEFAEVARREDGGQPGTPLTGQQFIEQLLQYRARFAQPPNVQLSLMQLCPADRDNLDGVWRGTGQLRMWGETAPGQPAEVVLLLRYEVPRPTEEALAQGGWLRACEVTQSLVAEAPRFLLREAAAERGIDPRRFHDNWVMSPTIANTGGVYLCDFNRDGILDVLITDVRCYALYQGLPAGKFRDVTAQAGLPAKPEHPSHHNAALADLDGDGWEDLILGERVYRNDGGKRFVDVTEQTNLRLPTDAAVAIADYDRDGLVDLYVARPGKPKAASWLDGKSGLAHGNQLWRNKGGWQFEDVTERAGAAGGHRSTFSAVWLDADNDGWPDLYVINEFGNGVLLLNERNGKFREHQLVDGPGDFGSMGVTCGDVDNDGNIDLYVANMYSKAGSRVIANLKPGTYPEDVMATMRRFVTGSQLYLNRGVEKGGESARPAPRFDPVGKPCQVAAVGWAYGAALFDLDNDGFLDIYATAGFISQSRTDPDG